MLACCIADQLCVTRRRWVCPLFLPRKLLFSRHLTALYHLYFIYFWFSSSFIHALHGMQPFLHALSSTHFLLHQYFISSSPLFSTCCCCFHSLSSFCHVFMQSSDIYSESDTLRPRLSLRPRFFVSCVTDAGNAMMFVIAEVSVLVQTYLDHGAVALATIMPVRGSRHCILHGRVLTKPRNFLTCRKTWLIEAEKWEE